MQLLAGIRVLDFGIWRPVPYATQLLVEMGAEVIKVEPPDGDPMRVFPELFAILNAGKRAAAIDLKDTESRQAVLELVAAADVVVEGYRPGVAERLGIGYQALHVRNPSLVYCSVSGYGQDGPLADLPGHDLNYQARAGLLEPRPQDGTPVVARPPLADLAGGVYAAMAICAALVRARTHGEGERIDVSMTDVLATWTGPLDAHRMDDGAPLVGGVPGYGMFATRDGAWITLGVLAEQPLWAALVCALGLDGLAALSFRERIERNVELDQALRTTIGERARDDLVEALTAAGVPVSPVLAQAELADDPQLHARRVVRRGRDGALSMVHPLKYQRHPPAEPAAVPALRQGIDKLPVWRA